MYTNKQRLNSAFATVYHIEKCILGGWQLNAVSKYSFFFLAKRFTSIPYCTNLSIVITADEDACCVCVFLFLLQAQHIASCTCNRRTIKMTQQWHTWLTVPWLTKFEDACVCVLVCRYRYSRLHRALVIVARSKSMTLRRLRPRWPLSNSRFVEQSV